MTDSPMSIVDATRSYERWLARHTRILADDLQRKHRKMAGDPFTFLRGTYYRWAQTFPLACSSIADAPRVSAVGDLHVENFGTWRDKEGRLIWGVNDLDEGASLPYTGDLVRLATSATLAFESRRMQASMSQACREILRGYRDSLESGGRPVVLAERHRWLRAIAVEELRNPSVFWQELRELPSATVNEAIAIAREALPPGAESIVVARRVAGVGSLGRRRYVALALLGGSTVAREGKALVPPASLWPTNATSSPANPLRLFDRAVRVHDPFLRVSNAWIIRRLAPDCVKIDITRLPRGRDDLKLLRWMGWETANLHLRGKNASVLLADLSARPKGWLMKAATEMTGRAMDDWKSWSRSQRAAR